MKLKLITLASAAIIGFMTVAIPDQAEAGWRRGGWWVPGAVVGGLALGAAIASGPYYYGPGYYAYGYDPDYYGGGRYYGRGPYYGGGPYYYGGGPYLYQQPYPYNPLKYRVSSEYLGRKVVRDNAERIGPNSGCSPQAWPK